MGLPAANALLSAIQLAQCLRVANILLIVVALYFCPVDLET